MNDTLYCDDDLDSFLAMKEEQAKEINKNYEIKKINELITKRKNKLNKISDFVNFKFDSKNNRNTNISYGVLINKNKLLFENEIKMTNNFFSCELSILMSLYFYTLHQANDTELIKQFPDFYNKYKKYKNEINDFIEKNNYIKQHNYVLLLLNDYIKHKKTIDYNSVIIDLIDKKTLCCYDITLYNKLKTNINSMLVSLNDLSKSILLNINNNDIENKDKKIELINSFTVKFSKMFDVQCPYNSPELCIFNTLINFSKTSDSIIYVLTQFVLPVSYIRPLIADVFIVLKINNKLQFGVIEYDGKKVG